MITDFRGVVDDLFEYLYRQRDDSLRAGDMAGYSEAVDALNLLRDMVAKNTTS
jgi:hypothetical protein